MNVCCPECHEPVDIAPPPAKAGMSGAGRTAGAATPTPGPPTGRPSSTPTTRSCPDDRPHRPRRIRALLRAAHRWPQRRRPASLRVLPPRREDHRPDQHRGEPMTAIDTARIVTDLTDCVIPDPQPGRFTGPLYVEDFLSLAANLQAAGYPIGDQMQRIQEINDAVDRMLAGQTQQSLDAIDLMAADPADVAE